MPPVLPPHLVVGTAGHIDHGKSTLVRALTGIDPDRLKEEKARGITIELGFAHKAIGDLTVAFVDVPGHERFVKTMLAGVGGMDCVLLVIAADESVMPQTREHFDICRLLGVAQGIVVLTKADLVDDETLELARLEVRELVAGSFLEGAPVLPVSANTGAGLDALEHALVAASRLVKRRRADGAMRLPIDRAFSMQGFGTVVTGTLVAGRLRVEDEVVLMPGDRRVRVRGIQVHGRRRDEAVTGQRTAVNLGGIEVAEIARGQCLAMPGSLCLTRRVDAVLDLLPSARPLRHGGRIRFHQGTDDVLGRVSIVGAASLIEPGQRAHVRLRLERPAALTRGDRFILRAYSPTVTIGGGSVLDPEPPPGGIRSAAAAARFHSMRASDEDAAAIERMVTEAGPKGLTEQALGARSGLSPSVVQREIEALESSGRLVRGGAYLFAGTLASTVGQRVLALVGDFHRAQPLLDGIPREEARERVLASGRPELFEAVVGALESGGTLIARDRLALAGHRLVLSADEVAARDAIERAYRSAGLKPPDAGSLAADLKLPAPLVDRMRNLLIRHKTLVRLDALVFHAEALDALKREIVALKEVAAGGRVTIDVATFKDRYGMSRKFAIPLLEWLDRERVTRRMGEARVVL